MANTFFSVGYEAALEKYAGSKKKHMRLYDADDYPPYGGGMGGSMAGMILGGVGAHKLHKTLGGKGRIFRMLAALGGAGLGASAGEAAGSHFDDMRWKQHHSDRHSAIIKKWNKDTKVKHHKG